VGLEVAWNSLKRALRRLHDPPRNNVRLLHLPAWPALRRLFEPKSLSAVRVFFPVPWPNKRQENKRIFTKAFFDILANRLTASGIFHLVTDYRDLALWVMEQSGGSPVTLTWEERKAGLNTKYERKWLSRGQETFYHLSGRVNSHPDQGGDRPGLSDMKPRYSELIDPVNYRPPHLTGDPTVIFGDFLYDNLRGKGLLQTKVVEDHFIQEFHILVSRQPDGRFKLSPALAGQVFPTMGVDLALTLAALEEPRR
jgi:tRNA (guanine-N7-)-methyltransferase